MPTGIMIGPYARQLVISAYTVAGSVTGDMAIGRLKFWFALSQQNGQIKRYEALIGKGSSTFDVRHRPYFGSRAPKYGANFHDYRLPEDLSGFPSLPLVRGETLASTALALLQGEDIADVTRMRLVGALPTRQAWQPIGDQPCTSSPQLPF